MKAKALLTLSLITLLAVPSFGMEPIRGTKNFRSALDGVLYIGGGNQLKQRDNRNPLLPETLVRLCEAGFSESIMMYTKTRDKMVRNTNCSAGNLKYEAISWTEIDRIMNRIHENIMTKKGPMYIHCYNGHHAANAIGAIAKMQFCGMSNRKAKDLWAAQTDKSGRDAVRTGKGFKSVLKRIRRFKANPALKLPSDLKAQLCD